MTIIFEVDTPPLKPRLTADEPAGDPASELYLSMLNPYTKKHLAAEGRIENEQDVRRVIFDEWYDITALKTPAEITTRMRKRVPNPLTIKSQALTSVTFQFSRISGL